MSRGLSYRRALALFVALALGVVAASLSPACRTATQVTVELRTVGALTCAQVKGVAIVVARTPQDAEAKMQLESLSAEVTREQCGADPRFLGTLVVTPSESTGAILVRARVRDDAAATCKPPDYRGCIVARRAFSFIDNAALTLPISLEQSCVDVPCDVVSSCRTGKCVSSDASCSESSGRCSSGAEPVVAEDGGIVPPPDDATVVVDGGSDSARDGDPSDAPADGPDASVDADASADADADATTTTMRTNNCPTPMGDIDCVTANGGATPFCCMFQTAKYDCTSMAGCFDVYPRYRCLGAKHCDAGNICCGTTVMPPTPSNVCALACADDIYCDVNADCPVDKPNCTGIVPGSVTMMDASRLWYCQ